MMLPVIDLSESDSCSEGAAGCKIQGVAELN